MKIYKIILRYFVRFGVKYRFNKSYRFPKNFPIQKSIPSMLRFIRTSHREPPRRLQPSCLRFTISPLVPRFSILYQILWGPLEVIPRSLIVWNVREIREKNGPKDFQWQLLRTSVTSKPFSSYLLFRFISASTFSSVFLFYPLNINHRVKGKISTFDK